MADPPSPLCKRSLELSSQVLELARTLVPRHDRDSALERSKNRPRSASASPKRKRHGAPDKQESPMRSYAKGKNSLWLLNSSAYSSMTMKGLLDRRPASAAAADGDPTSAQPPFSPPLLNGSGSRGIPLQELVGLASPPRRPISRHGSTGGASNLAGKFESSGGFAMGDNGAHGAWPAPQLCADTSVGAAGSSRDAYTRAFSGPQSYGETGATVLEELVDAAFHACCVARDQGQREATGAAVLTESGRMYAGCTVESRRSPELAVAAERTAVLKAVSEGQTRFRALVLASDSASNEFPVPDGAGRQFLAEYGDFPVCLVNQSRQVKTLTTHELFPLMPRSPARLPTAQDEAIARASRDSGGGPRSWGVSQVLAWLEDRMDMPEYRGEFVRAKVDGALLLNLEEQDLDILLHVHNPLHRRKLLLGVETLKDREFDLTGPSTADLESYTRSLDSRRVRLIARLKAAFDRFADDDADGAGLAPAAVARKVIRYLGRDPDAEAPAAWLAARERSDAPVDFTEFAAAYVDMFGSEDPDVPLADTGGSWASSRAPHSAITVTQRGHVRLGSREHVAGGASTADGVRTRSHRNETQTRDTSSRDGEDVLAAAAAAGVGDNLSVRRLAEAKRVFDRFAVGGALTPQETLQAFAESGSTVPRADAAQLLREHGHHGSRRDVSFSGFIRALTALDGDGAASLDGRSNSERLKAGNGSRGRQRRELDDDQDAWGSTSISVKRGRSPIRPASRGGEAEREKGGLRRLLEGGDASDADADGAETLLEDRRAAAAAAARRYTASESEPRRQRWRDPLDDDDDGDGYEKRRDARKRAGGSLRGSPIKHRAGSSSSRHGGRDDASRGNRSASRSRASSRGHGRGRSSGVESELSSDESDGEKSSHRRPHHRQHRRNQRQALGDSSRSSSNSSAGFGGSSSHHGRRTKPASDRSSANDSRRKQDQRVTDDSDEDRGRKPQGYSEGDAVEVESYGRYTRATVTRRHSDGTYDVRYDDGDKERGVRASKLRPAKISGSSEAGRNPKARGAIERSGGGGSGGASDDGRLSGSAFDVGDKVEADYKGRGHWLLATVQRKHRDGSYDLRYEDGRREESVRSSLLRQRPASGRPANGNASDRETERRAAGNSPAKFEVGDLVEADFKGKGRYFKGKVTLKHRDGTLDVRYDDGDTEERIEPLRVRMLPSSSNGSGKTKDTKRSSPDAAGGGSAVVGDRVEVNFKGKGRWFKGSLTAKHRDGTFDVRYDDGDTEERVEPANVRLLAAAGREGKARSDDRPGSAGDKFTSSTLAVGDKVEANYKGKGRWFKGSLTAKHRDGTFDVRYDDGDSEERVEPANVRLLAAAGRENKARSDNRPGSAGDKSTSSTPDVGDKVEANYKGKGRWFKGLLTAKHRDGTFDVRYDDGDSEDNMEARNVRLLEPASRSRNTSAPGGGGGSSSIVVGDRIEANFKGKGRWFKGEVLSRNRDGTFDVRYDDGDKEQNVESQNVRSIGAVAGEKGTSERPGSPRGGLSSTAAVIDVGDRVEANYKGKGRWFCGKVTAKHRDATLDVRFDDGDIEERIEASRVRRVGGGSGGDGSSSKKRDGSPDAAAGSSIAVGDRVEANYKGKGRWFKGKVTAKHRDGTYDVRYDDGDSEDNVELRNLRSLAASAGLGASSSKRDDAGAPGSSLEVGDKVEANYKGKGRWFFGKVTAKHRDATLDVRYDDGDTEERIEPSRIRLVGGISGGDRATEKGSKNRDRSPDAAAGSSIVVGDRVEANFKGKGRWFKGKVTAKHRDGTYDVRYDDGDSEDNVELKNLRSLAASAGLGASGSKRDDAGAPGSGLEVGDKVEANYKGKGRWFAGKIAAKHRDGSFDIRYDDGDSEENVDEGNVRPLEAASRNRDKQAPRGGGDGGGSFAVGDRVEANFKGKGRWFKAKISSKNRDNTFDVRYDDGDEELSVELRNLRALAGGAADGSIKGSSSNNRDDGTASPRGAAASAAPEVGDKVEVNYKGKGRWFKGLLTAKHRDSTFDVRYDDGDSEERVEPANVRLLAAAGREDKARSERPGSPGDKSTSSSLAVGDKVEANYKGKGRWFCGKITAKHRDATLDVRFDDGDIEERIEASRVRRVGGGSGGDGSSSKKRDGSPDAAAGSSIAVGDRVEANYKGKGRWFKGKVTTKHRDGTYDVRYDDGDSEDNVELRNLRSLAASAGLGASSSKRDDAGAPGAGLEVGDKVEANYKGKGRWFAGKIAAKHRDGTFDVRYDDGDSEEGVEQRNLRLVGAAAPSSTKEMMRPTAPGSPSPRRSSLLAPASPTLQRRRASAGSDSPKAPTRSTDY